jgi:hypothetical protein
MRIFPDLLPETVGVVFLVFCLALTLAPFLGGRQFGDFKIPELPPGTPKWIVWVGLALLASSASAFQPWFGPPFCYEPIERVEVVTPEQVNTCAHPSFDRASWTHDVTTDDLTSGWVGGGHDQPWWCNQAAQGFIANRGIGSDVEVTTVRSSEESKKDFFGQVTYKFHCTLHVRWGSIYNQRQHPVCGVTPAVTRNVQIGQRRISCPVAKP